MTPSYNSSPEGLKTLRDEFEVTNGIASDPFYISPDRNLAIAYVKANASRLPGLYVEHVVIYEQRRRAYRPRPVLVR